MAFMRPLMLCLWGASFLSAQSPLFKDQLAKAPGGIFVVFTEDGDGISTLEDARLAGWSPSRWFMGQNLDSSHGQTIKGRFQLNASITWAVFLKGETVASGIGAPDPEVISTSLQAHQVPNLIWQTQAFLQVHPDHLDARKGLLAGMVRHAAEHTRTRLRLDAQTPSERIRQAGTSPVDLQTAMFSQPEDATKLEDAADQRLWQPVVRLLDEAFASDDWITLVPQAFDRFTVPLVDHTSTLLTQAYARHIDKVEACLRKWPSDTRLWALWLRMAMPLKRSAGAFFQSLPSMPPESGFPWPPIAVQEVLVLEFQKTQQWHQIVGLLLPSLPGTWTTVDGLKADAKASGVLTRVEQLSLDDAWKRLLEPLMEALLRSGDSAHAQEVFTQLQLRRFMKPYLHKAISMAARCGRKDLEARWRASMH